MKYNRADLPHKSIKKMELDEQELHDFLEEHLHRKLTDAIAQEIHFKLIKLKKSRRYAPLAHQFIPGLRLYYCQNQSLKEIAPQLGMTSWDQARRILNPGGVLSRVRELCVQTLLDRVLLRADQKGLIELPPELNYLKSLVQQVENFVDQEIFQEATAEIKSRGNRSRNSLYAQKLRLILEEY